MGVVAQGTTYTGDVYIRNAAQELVDPDSGTLALTIKRPNGTTLLAVNEAGLTRLSQGHFEYGWVVAADLPVLTYTWNWDAVIDDANLPDAVEDVVVVPAGSLDSGVLLTVTQLREHVSTELADAAIQRLIDLASWEVAQRAGAVGSVTETVDGWTNRIVLSRPALSITSVSETDTGTTTIVLAANDYSHRSPYVLERLVTGTNPAHSFNYRVSAVYVPVDDLLLRQGVVIDLVRFDIAHEPGLTSLSVGDWSESYAPAERREREAILARLDPAPTMRII